MRRARTTALTLPTLLALLSLPTCTPNCSRPPRVGPGAVSPPAAGNTAAGARPAPAPPPAGPRPDLPRLAGLRCPIAFDDADVVLARVGEQAITACDLAVAAEMDTREGLPALSPRQLLDRAVRDALFAAEARNRGLDRDVDAARRVRDTMAAALVRSEAMATAGWAAPTDQEVEAYYRAHQDDFTTPERVHLREVVLADEQAARDAIAAAGSAPFESLLERTVTREGQRDRGDLGLVPRAGNDRVPREVAEAGFSLTEPGSVFPQPVRVESVEYTGSGRHRRAQTRVTFHVVQLLGRLEGATVPLAEAARQIRFRMAFGHYQRERRIAEERLVAALRAEHPPSVNAALLRRAHVRRAEPPGPVEREPADRHEHSHHRGH